MMGVKMVLKRVLGVLLLATVLALVPLAVYAQGAQDAQPVIPVQLEQLLALALSVVFVTQALKAIATQIGGKGAIVVSAVVSIVLTLLAYGAGWVPLTTPACVPEAPLQCIQDWLATAVAAMALANLLYVAVYSRVFGTTPAPTTTGMVAKKGI